MDAIDANFSSSTDIFDLDRQRREALAQTVQKIIDSLSVLEMNDEEEKAIQLKKMVLQDTFKVLVLGEFKTGKSTFINALLGEEILPSYATPTTAIINEIKWGDNPQALLHFPEEDEKQPLPINVHDLEEYVVIKDEAEREIRESPYSFVELFWPINLCRNNVEIIDSPGLNENKVREKVTIDYLRKVDAVLFVMTALRLGPGIHEQKTLDMLGKSGHDELFFIVNQFDLLRRDRDREGVIKRANDQLAQYTKRKDAIHFISSLDALDGRVDKDFDRVHQSGILPLEELLFQFLGNERSRIKTKRAAIELQLIIANAQRLIPDKRAYLRTPLAELRQRYEASRSKFDELRENKNDIVRRVEAFRRQINNLVTSKVRIFFADNEQQVDKWVEDYSIQIKLNLNVKKQIENIVQDINIYLQGQLETEFNTWSEEILVPLIDHEMDSLQRTLERQANEFEANLEKVRFELAGTTISHEDMGVSREGPKNALERTLAAAGGFLIGGVAGAGLGALFGWREVFKAILPQIMIGAVAGIAGLPLLPLVLAAGVLQGGLTTAKIVKRIREETTKVYKQKLRELAAEQAQEIARQLDRELEKLVVKLEQSFMSQIDGVENQVKLALSKQEEGQQAVEKKLSEINVIEKKLSETSTQIIDFIATVEHS